MSLGRNADRKRPYIAKELLERRKRHWHSTRAICGTRSEDYTTLRTKGYASLVQVQTSTGQIVLATNVHVHQHDIRADVDARSYSRVSSMNRVRACSCLRACSRVWPCRSWCCWC